MMRLIPLVGMLVFRHEMYFGGEEISRFLVDLSPSLANFQGKPYQPFQATP